MNAAKKLEKKRKLVRILVIIAAVLILLTAAVITLRTQVTKRFAVMSTDDIKTANVTVGSISSTVSGSGYLADMDIEDMELYNSVDVLKTVVQAGDKVKKGDVLATVDLPSVLEAMKTLQSELDSLDSQINTAADDVISGSIGSSVTGRVKELFIRTGDRVADVMAEHGAVMVLSLDGTMALEIPAGDLAVGDTLTVTRQNGKAVEGTVDQILTGTATVLVSDDGPAKGERVTVSDAAGKELGSGELSIHRPMNITGYAGTASYVYVKENSPVSSGSTLVTLTDTAYKANYDSLLSKRADTEKLLNQLITIYRDGAVCAPYDGSVSTISMLGSDNQKSTATVTEAASSSDNTRVLLSLCPDKTVTVSVSVDESDILALEKGQDADITIESIGDEVFTGTVTGIEKTGTSSNGVTTYTTEITLDKSPEMIAGMTAQAAVRIQGVDDALLIPSDALHQSRDKSYVYTSLDPLTGEMSGMTEVTAGLNNGSYVEITSGLKEGDTVYYTEKENRRFGSMGGGNSRPAGNTVPSGGGPGGGTPPGGAGAPGGGGGRP